MLLAIIIIETNFKAQPRRREDVLRNRKINPSNSESKRKIYMSIEAVRNLRVQRIFQQPRELSDHFLQLKSVILNYKFQLSNSQFENLREV